MGRVSWTSEPGPGVTGSTRVVMVAAFSGWNDAGDAASGAIDRLWWDWDAVPVATLDPEEFTDFTANRPRITVEAGLVTSLEWPTTEFGWSSTGDRAVVLVRGPEPQLRWRTWCDEVLGVADRLGCSTLITLGAMLSDVPHTRPTPVFANALEPSVLDALELPASNYDGPTGIPGVLHEAAGRAGIDAVALWAAVPAYAAGMASPPATRTLARHTAALVGRPLDTADGAGDEDDRADDEYVERLDELCSSDEETAEWVRQLEELHDAEREDEGSAEALVQEVERFLRDQ